MEPSTIRNFVALGERLATAGQPTEAELGELAQGGFEVVVNLGLLDPKYCLPDEAGSARALGLEYHHIPVSFQQPLPEDFERFRAVMLGSQGKKVLVHCAMNFRVSCFVALWSEQQLGWSREQADAHIQRLWEPNEAWRSFMEAVRQGWQKRA